MTVYIPTHLEATSAYSTVETFREIRKTLILMGVPIDNLTMTETLEKVEEFVEVGRATGKHHQVATVNTDFLVKSLEDDNLRDLLQNADLCTPDGMPLVWGSKLLGVPLKERVAGSDMVPMIAERAARKGMTLYFMGAAPGVADEAKRMLEERYEGLQVVGTSCPFWKPGEQFDQAVLDEIKALNPDILLVALGNPKQELWIKTYGAEVGVPVQIGVGASLDFIVGRTKRAPKWMQKTGLEWVARLVQEPRRLWKRYALDAVRFAPSLMRQWWIMRPAAQTDQSFSIEMRSIGHVSIMNVKGGFTRFHSQNVRDAGERALRRRANLTINLADVTNLDCNAIGTLMSLRKMAEETGGELRIVGIQKPLQRIFDMLHLASFFELDESSLVLGLR